MVSPPPAIAPFAVAPPVGLGQRGQGRHGAHDDREVEVDASLSQLGRATTLFWAKTPARRLRSPARISHAVGSFAGLGVSRITAGCSPAPAWVTTGRPRETLLLGDCLRMVTSPACRTVVHSPWVVIEEAGEELGSETVLARRVAQHPSSRLWVISRRSWPSIPSQSAGR